LLRSKDRALTNWARDKQHDFNQARENIVKAATAEDAQTILDDLELSVRE
jgi:hypothetical protein